MIKYAGDTYISELCNKYTSFKEVKSFDLIRHLMNKYGKFIETDLKENQKIFDEALDTMMPIWKYFEMIDYCIQYADGGKQP